MSEGATCMFEPGRFFLFCFFAAYTSEGGRCTGLSCSQT